MKKMYLFLLMVFLAIGSGTLYAQQRVLDEGFESSTAGSLPTGWSQDPSTAAKLWGVEINTGNNLNHPASCATGNGRIKYQGTAGADAQSVKLITNTFDITRLAKPILVFDYAAIKATTGNVDTLKVYYRIRSDRAWTLVKTYGEADKWTRDTIDFLTKTATFQIAFEGVDNDGRGVALDNVHFTSRRVCEEISDVVVYNKIHTEAKLRWSGSLTAKYNVVIATDSLDDPTTATEADGVYIRQAVEYVTNIQLNATANKALTPSTTYYYYIQSDCGYGDVSDWVTGEFTTACEPVTNFSTSFDTPEDIACWNMIGEGYGKWIGTAPNVVSDSVMNGIATDGGKPIFHSPSSLISPHTGSSALWMYTMSENQDDYTRVYAVSPRLADDVDLSKMQISFWAKSNTVRQHLRVIVSDWPDDFSNAEQSGEIVVKTTNSYEFFTITFEDVNPTAKYIAFMVDGSEEILPSSPQYPLIHIDDLVFEEKQVCDKSSKVSLYARPVVTGTTAFLKWNRSGASKYNVKVSTSMINPVVDPGVAYDNEVSKPEVNVTGLAPSTRYYYFVQPVCADGTVGTWSNAQTFDTECLQEGLALPLRENFDNIKTAQDVQSPLPVCWSTLLSSDEGNGIGVTMGKDAPSAYNYVSYRTQFNTGYLIAPKINADLSTCQVTFQFKVGAKDVALEVGVMSDPTQSTTFTSLGTVASAAANTWQEYSCSLAGYTGSGKYVALHFKETNTNGGYAYNVDNVVVELQPQCDDVEDFRQVASTATSMTFDWTVPEDATGMQWEIAYGQAGAKIEVNTTTVPGVTTHPYEVSGLETNVTYDVYIRSVCSGNAKGRWIGPITARTIAPATLPYFCDFEDEEVAGGWVLANGNQDNQWIIGDVWAEENNTGRTMFISSDYGLSNYPSKQETYSYAYRTLNLQAGLVDFEFNWRQPGLASNKAQSGALVPFLAPADFEINGGTEYGKFYNIQTALRNGRKIDRGVTVPANWIMLMPEDRDFLAASDTTWQHYKFTYPLRQSGEYKFVILYITPSSYYIDATKNASAVDSVSIVANTTSCTAPVDMATFEITQSTAKVRFLNYNATNWNVVVTTETLADNEAVENAIANGVQDSIIIAEQQGANPLQLSGLQPETQYYAYVRPVCGDVNTWSMIDFRTICQSQALPISFSFDEPEFLESDTTYEEIRDWWTDEIIGIDTVLVRKKTFLDCWRRIPQTPTSYSYAKIGMFKDYKEIYETNRTQMMELRAYAGVVAYLVSPEIDMPLNQVQITFRAVTEYDYAKYGQYLEVGAMTDPLDPSTFTLIQKVTPLYAGQWKTYSAYFDVYEGAGKHVAIRMPSSSFGLANLFIDDLKIDQIKGCVPARTIAIDTVTPTSASISWGVVGDTLDYHVKVTSSPLGRWDDAGDIYDDTIQADNKATIPNLLSSKLYYVYVRTVCSDGTFSSGMSEATFRTSCPVEATLPFYENFDSYDENEMPECWTVVSGPEDYPSCANSFDNTDIVYGPYKSLGKLSLSIISGRSGKYPGVVAMPSMLDENVKDLSISFKALMIGLSNSLIVGVVSNLDDINTFVAVDTISNMTPYSWQDFVVDFSSYTGSGKYIAFYLNPGQMTEKSYYIDNVLVRKSAVTCADAAAPQVLNVTATTATVRWSDNTTVESFEVKVSSREINPEIDAADILPATIVNDLSTDLTGLTPATEYFVYLRNVCTGDTYGYWSDATTFKTSCQDPQALPYIEQFTGYGEIADQGFFPACWRSRVLTYGNISTVDQPAPYIENAARPSLYMRASYDAADDSYAIVDAVTPELDFGDAGISEYMMSVTFRSNVVGAPIYIGLMSDASDASTFVAYDTIASTVENDWETQVINFIGHPDNERYIAFRLNSLDAFDGDEDFNGYYVNITDIEIESLEDCMPPYRVNVDLRPNRAFISWMPGDKTSNEWKYYYSDNSEAMDIPFTDEEFIDGNEWGDITVIDSTSAHTLVLNDIDVNSVKNFYIKTKACDKFYPQRIDLSNRPDCGKINVYEDLPIVPDFTINGYGVGAEPQYSAYFDCWKRTDSFEGDPVAYPYINEQGELLFHSVADSVSTAYMLQFDTEADTVIAESQLRFTAKGLAEGAKVIIGLAGYYTEGWPAQDYFDDVPYDTIELTTEYAEYICKFEGYEWVEPGSNYYRAICPSISIVDSCADFVINDINFELIPRCYTPELSLVEHDNTSYAVEWSVLEGQTNWEVAFGVQGFDLETAKWTPRTDANYTVVNQKEGTPYEFFLRSLCDNGMTSEYARICATTDQTPAQYPYTSANFADATAIDADDTLYYAYRTISIPAGPHTLTFDWKLADDANAFLRVFSVPADVMIAADAPFAITATGAPEGWTEVATLTGKSAWTAASHTMYVKAASAGAAHLLFAWTHSGADVKEVVRNVNVNASNECTVPEALMAYQITASSAVISWTSYNANSWDMIYFETALGESSSKTVTDVQNGHLLSGLNADTEYSVMVASVCRPGEYSEVYTFRTACAALDALSEPFETTDIDNCWRRYHGLFDDVVADPAALVPAEKGWAISTKEIIGSAGTQSAVLAIADDNCAEWLISPAVNIKQNSALSFLLALTAYDSQASVANPSGQIDDRFIVAVSDDEGKTWKAQNATIWNNDDDVNYIYNRIGNHSRRIDIDLSAYTGKTIRIAFYGESTVALESNDLHIDSVVIEPRAKKTVSDSYCMGYTYDRNGFSIDRQDLVVAGNHVFTRNIDSGSDAVDTIVVLNLEVKGTKEYEYDVQICDIETYSDGNFTDLDKSGTYTRIREAANGCDSIIILNLVVNPSYKIDQSIEIDAEELPFQFACHLFPVGTVSGSYQINCPTVAGCDSIVNLTLTVKGGTAVDNVESADELLLTPNPVGAGDMVTVNYEFSHDELAGLTVGVYNSLGQAVSVSAPQGMPVAFRAPEVAGVYTVRITTADNRVLLGRFIVR